MKLVRRERGTWDSNHYPGPKTLSGEPLASVTLESISAPSVTLAEYQLEH